MARAVLLDIDGVLTTSWRPLAGAAECIRWLQEHDVGFRLVTNTSSKSRREIAADLAAVGVQVDGREILTAVTAASRYLAVHHPGLDCYIVNEGELTEDLRGVTAVGPESAGVVLLGGAGPSTGYIELNNVFRLAMDGVPVVALHRNTHFQSGDGPVLDMGAFLSGIEAAAGIDIPVVGKPARAFFDAALFDLGVSAADALMVGDDIRSDVLGAQALGVVGVLVKTGKFRPADLEVAAPDHVIDGIGDLPDLLQRMEAAEA
ncbi:MAG: TIGR01458 family HAD-type hydrolase [Acidimicrobiales bacterium]|jgi:HAD superfamily hydrolase (TIGR01458 family)